MTRLTLGEFLSTRPNAKITLFGPGGSVEVWPSEAGRFGLLEIAGAIDTYGTWHSLREDRTSLPWVEMRADTPSHFLRCRPEWGCLARVQINDTTFTLAESIDWPDGEIMEVVERGVWRCQQDGTRIAFTAFLEAPCQPS